MHAPASLPAPRPAVNEVPGNGTWGALLIDQDGIIRNCSPMLSATLGRDGSGLIGQPLRSVLPGFPIRPHTPGYNRAFTAFWQNRRGLCHPLLTPENRAQAQVEATLCCIPGAADQAPPMILVGLRFPSGLLDNRSDFERMERMAECSSKTIMITDRRGIITYVNPVFERLTGYPRQEAIGKPASLLKSGLHDESFYKRLWLSLNHEREFQAVFANRRRNGEIYLEEKRIRPFVDRDGDCHHFVAVSHPVDDFLQSTLLRLERQANHDPLTGLPNRNLFLDRLDQLFSRAVRHGTRFALAYVDLDGFKAINDRHGHAAGDTVLQAAGQLIHNALRETDTVGRLGGDEFGILLSDIGDEDKVPGIIDKVLAALAHGIRWEGRDIPIVASIGVSCYPTGGLTPTDMMRQADTLMYRCKLAGGGGFRLAEAAAGEAVAAQAELPGLSPGNA